MRPSNHFAAAVFFASLIVGSFAWSADSVKGVAKESPGGAPSEKGRSLFVQNCVTCHGDKGDGMGPAGQYMNPKPRNWTKDKFKNGDSIDAIAKTIHQGIEGTSMPGFPDFTPEDLVAVAKVVKSIRGK
jgi:mono/diheme cytochrome c family protein